MKVSDVVAAVETLAPPALAAEGDNVGLLIGDARAGVRKLLLCIDLTEGVLAEADAARAQMVMAYHPVIFKPVSALRSDGPGATAYRAARRGLAVYSPHTALDAAAGGTNDCLADVLGLTHRRPLEPSVGPRGCKVVVFVPAGDVARVSRAAFGAGAGRIGGYTGCAFRASGTGTFCGGEGTRPAVGRAGRGETVQELRLEMVCPEGDVGVVVEAIRGAHSYEEPAIDVYPLSAPPGGCGMGRVGRLKRPASPGRLVSRVKRSLGLKRLLVAGPGAGRGSDVEPVTTAACCAGSCGAMFRSAESAGATFYLTGEMRHHDARAASAAGMTVVCVGHSHSERLVLHRIVPRLRRMLPKLAVAVAESDRDPFEIV